MLITAYRYLNDVIINHFGINAQTPLDLNQSGGALTIEQ